MSLATLGSVAGIGSDAEKKLYPPIYCEDGTTPISARLAGLALQSPWVGLLTSARGSARTRRTPR